VTDVKANTGIRRFAALTAAMTLVLILAGGFVTTTRTGDTIPTWPRTWGQLYAPGWLVEASHRYVASTVGLLSLALAFWLHQVEPRRWVRRIGWIALAAVLLQAALGGLRIAADHKGFFLPKAPVAILHACFGQVVFCGMVAIALVVSRSWVATPIDASAHAARKLGVVTTVFAFLQLVAGAVTRHTGAGLIVHLIGAGLVLLHVSLLASRLMLTPLRRAAHLLLGLLGAQLLLGLATWAITAGGFVRSHESPVVQILTITSHVAVGAALLATCLAVTLLCQRGEEAAPVAVGAVNA
jgi:cytochrome c oxidase assembly protein subunit 15